MKAAFRIFKYLLRCVFKPSARSAVTTSIVVHLSICALLLVNIESAPKKIFISTPITDIDVVTLKPKKTVAPAPAKKSPTKKQNKTGIKKIAESKPKIVKKKTKPPKPAQKKVKLEQKKQETKTSPPKKEDVPANNPTAKEIAEVASISVDQWLSKHIKESWTFSKYLLTKKNPEAQVELVFDRNGTLLSSRFLKESGDKVFDQSIEKAIKKMTALPFKPGTTVTRNIVFNLNGLEG